MKLVIQRTSDGKYLEGWRKNFSIGTSQPSWDSSILKALVIASGDVFRQDISPMPNDTDLRLIDLDETEL